MLTKVPQLGDAVSDPGGDFGFDPGDGGAAPRLMALGNDPIPIRAYTAFLPNHTA
jgi:hypothetical protein